MAVNGTGSLVILVIVFFGALAFQAQVEEKPQDKFIRDKEDNVSRIIDHTKGEDAEPEEAKPRQFPWQVLVLSEQLEGEGLCGGSIIDQEWIMSAAHCFSEELYDEDKKPNRYKIISERVSLIVGVINMDDYGPNRPIVFEDVSNNPRVFIHEDYNKNIDSTNDIALFKLEKPLTLNNFVKPILLATAEDVIPGKELTASGWGKMAYDIWKPYQSDKYWTLAQCPLVEGSEGSELYPEVSLNTCMMKCASNDACTVFWYKAKLSECRLQNCNGQIPEPTGKLEDTIGYSVQKVWKPYQDKYWPLEECPMVEGSDVYMDVSLNTCMMKCASNGACTVFLYNAEQTVCRLQNCNGQIPVPTVKLGKHIGYFNQKVWKPYHSGKYWTLAQCPLVERSELYRGVSLNECIWRCTSIDACTVFLYNAEQSECGLQNCNGQIPEPIGKPGDNIGYFNQKEYKAHQTSKVWSIGECPRDDKYPKKFQASLKDCMDVCTISKSCNAFIYNADQSLCDPRFCPSPIPVPTASVDGSIGYILYKGRTSTKLRYVIGLDLKTKDICASLYTDPDDIVISETMICYENHKKTHSEGDSGGPITFLVEGSEPPINVQIGIVSFETFDTLKPNVASVMTNVAKLRPWIHAIMGGCPPGDSSINGCKRGTRAIFTRSGSEQCVLVSCPDDGDFFTLSEGGPKQCFKVLKQSATWEQANTDCMDLNLTLAQPFAPVQLRSYIVQEYGSEFYFWLGACQDKPNKMMWKEGGEEISNDDPLWYPGQPNYHKGCLLLLTSESYLQKEPEKPFWNVRSTYEFYPLCELVLE